MPKDLIKIPSNQLDKLRKITFSLEVFYDNDTSATGSMVITGKDPSKQFIDFLNSIDSISFEKREFPKKLADDILTILNEADKEISEHFSGIREYINDWRKSTNEDEEESE